MKENITLRASDKRICQKITILSCREAGSMRTLSLNKPEVINNNLRQTPLTLIQLKLVKGNVT